MSLLDGTLPAQYGLRTAGVVDKEATQELLRCLFLATAELHTRPIRRIVRRTMIDQYQTSGSPQTTLV